MKTIGTLFILLFAGLLISSHTANAQSKTLAYNQAKIVSSTPETVPAGKVWKITSIYGSKAGCRELICGGSWGPYSLQVNYSGFKVNGSEIYSYNTLPTTISYTSSSCGGSTCTVGCGPWTTCQAIYNELLSTIPANPNLLPMWLPAGTTVETLDAKIFISVLEFNEEL